MVQNGPFVIQPNDDKAFRLSLYSIHKTIFRGGGVFDRRSSIGVYPNAKKDQRSLIVAPTFKKCNLRTPLTEQPVEKNSPTERPTSLH
jgi:hypothetical protein